MFFTAFFSTYFILGLYNFQWNDIEKERFKTKVDLYNKLIKVILNGSKNCTPPVEIDLTESEY